MSPEVLDTLKGTLQAALKERDTLRVSVLRMLLSSSKNKEIELKRSLTDDDLIGVIAAQIKLRKEAVGSYRHGGRADLAEKEEAEIRILQEFLPPQLSEQEIKNIIESAVKKAGAQSPKDMGKVMKEIMPEIKGRADGKQVNQLVKERLSS